MRNDTCIHCEYPIRNGECACTDGNNLVPEPALTDKAVFASTDWVGLLEAALRDATELEKAAARSGKAWRCYMPNATEYLRTALEAERGRCPTGGAQQQIRAEETP